MCNFTFVKVTILMSCCAVLSGCLSSSTTNDPISSNTAPSVSSSTNSIILAPVESFSHAINAIDLEDVVTFSADNLPSWVSIDPVTGVISGTAPNTTTDINEHVTVYVSDGVNTVSYGPVSIQVIYTALSIAGTPPENIEAYQFYSFTPEVLGQGVGTVSFTVINKPDWAIFDSETGRLSGTPPQVPSNQYHNNIRITAADANGITSAIGDFSIAVAPSLIRCEATEIRCIGPGQEYDTNAFAIEKQAFGAAIGDAVPGDILKIKGGTYVDHATGLAYSRILNVTKSGTADNPIIIEAFDGERVHLHGAGVDDSTLIAQNQQVVRVEGDYVHLRNLEISNSHRWGVFITGSHGLYENLSVHNNSDANIIVTNEGRNITGNIFRYIESYHSRNNAGLILAPWGAGYTITHQLVERSIAYNNGFHPGRAHQPGEGSNSDGFGTFKTCHDNALALYGITNRCKNNIFRENISWHNADDGIDLIVGDGSQVVGNISFDNGPEGNRGFKILRAELDTDVTYLGNIAINNMWSGFDLRNDQGIKVYHNLSLHNVREGLGVMTLNTNFELVKFYNNISSMIFHDAVADFQKNWETSLTSPQLNNIDFDKDAVDTSFVASLTLSNRDKWRQIYQQFIDAYSPSVTSPLIDEGSLVVGVHCSTADDDPVSPMHSSVLSCRHWRGTAPDIGVFEYGTQIQ